MLFKNFNLSTHSRVNMKPLAIESAKTEARNYFALDHCIDALSTMTSI